MDRIKNTVRAACSVAATAVGVLMLSGAAATQGANSTLIQIKDFMFVPMTTTIKAGTTVVWQNADDEPHTVVSDDGLFRSNALDTKEQFRFTFTQPGTYHVLCSIHPRMRLTIVVD